MIFEDWSEAREQSGELFAPTMATYTEEAASLLDGLSAVAAENDDWSEATLAEVARKLHTLKGTSGQTGLIGLSNVVHKLEDRILAFRATGALPPKGALAVLIEFSGHFGDLLRMFASGQPEKAAVNTTFELLVAAASMPLETSEVSSGAAPTRIEAASKSSEKPSLALRQEDFDELFATLKSNIALFSAGDRNARTLEARTANEKALYALVKARVTSARSLVARLRKLVTDTAKMVGKDVAFKMEGFDVSIDRQLVQALSEILTHMLRNGVDHALESVAERKVKGKPATGNLTLILSIEGDRTIVRLSDDGRGIDGAAVAAKAIQKGVVTSAAVERMSKYEKQYLIFLPGFSTRDTATDVSGRGVGMDAVSSEMRRFGGKLTFSSTLGTGTEFRIEFPSPYQFESCLQFLYGDKAYAIPAKFVRGVVTDSAMAQADFGVVTISGLDETYMQIELKEVDERHGDASRPLVLLELAATAVCLRVDRVLGVSRQLLYANDRHPDLPAYLNGVGEDQVLGLILGIDCTELERNLNVYFESTDDTSTALVDHSNNEDTTMFKATKLEGRQTRREDVIAALDGKVLTADLEAILAYSADDPVRNARLKEAVLHEKNVFKTAIAEVSDLEELQYMIAIRYAAIKANWIMLNIQMQYENAADRPNDPFDMEHASMLTAILAALEPLANEEAIKAITEVLGTPMNTTA